MLNILFLLAQVVLYCSCYEIKAVGEWQTKIGDSPHYDVESNSLLYTDAIGEYKLVRYDLSKKKVYKAKIEGIVGRIGFFLPIRDRSHKFLVGNELGMQVVKWDGKSDTAELYCSQFQKIDISTNFIHDGKVDSHGRLYVGTLRNEMCNLNSTLPGGALFRSDDGITLKKLVPNLTITNDMAIDEKRNILYVVESCSTTIKAFNWDPKTGDISNGRNAVDFHTELLKEYPAQIPDSAKLDTQGKLWVTANGQGSVVRFDPKTGKVLQKIQLPVVYVESLAFGGPDMDILYVTTNGVEINPMTGNVTSSVMPPHYGSLYQITGLGVHGILPHTLPKEFASCAPEKSVKHFFKHHHHH